MQIVLFWIGMGIVAAFLARAEHRSPVLWLLLGCVLGPIAPTALAFMGDEDTAEEDAN